MSKKNPSQSHDDFASRRKRELTFSLPASVTSVSSHRIDTESDLDDADRPKTPTALRSFGVSITKHLSIANTSSNHEYEARVLVLYTGGTIGMRVNNAGVYVPEPNFLERELRKMTIFHDTEYENQVKPDGQRRQGPQCLQPLYLPLPKSGRRVEYVVHEYTPLLDSSNMSMTDWARIATDIEFTYEYFNGFVILHGTDTMAYTASALSFMMEHLGKPVILTGSQIPIFEVRSDGRDNFLGALIVASHYCIPEVSLYFHNALYRGNRSIKCASNDFEAFTSPNCQPLVTLAIDINVNWSSIYQPRSTSKFCVHASMCDNVGLLRLFPGITTSMVTAFLQHPLEGAVVQTYGSGNGPDARKDMLKAFQDASERGVIILNITQCTSGGVSLTYGTGKALQDAGMVSGFDMTPEAALTKLAYVLSKDEWDLPTRRKMLCTNLRGELTKAEQIKTEQSVTDYPLFSAVADSLNLTSVEEKEALKRSLFPALINAATLHGDVKSLDNMLAGGGSLGHGDYCGRTSLHIAASEGNATLVEYLLKHGALVHARDNQGQTPLNSAIANCHLDVIRILKNTGAHLLLPPVKIGMELCHAAACSNIQKLSAWMAAGADINTGDYSGQTALHVAVQNQHLSIVHFLLKNNANPLGQDRMGNSAISLAHSQNNQQMESVLKDACQNPQ